MNGGGWEAFVGQNACQEIGILFGFNKNQSTISTNIFEGFNERLPLLEFFDLKV